MNQLNTQSANETTYKRVRFNLDEQNRPLKQVHFDLEKTAVKEIPSLRQYNFGDLHRLHYRRSDYEEFQKAYEQEHEENEEIMPIYSLSFLYS